MPSRDEMKELQRRLAFVFRNHLGSEACASYIETPLDDDVSGIEAGMEAREDTARAHSYAAWVVWRDRCRLDILESVVVFGWPHALVRRAESGTDRSRDPFHGQAC